MASRQTKKIIIKTLLKKSAGQLEPAELDDLLALVLGKTKEYIYKNPDKALNRSQIKAFKKILDKRLSGWPMAYLRGYQEFYGLKFLVSKHTLIPRPESELIIDEALKFTKAGQNIIDIGTGSGCLILSLAKNNTRLAENGESRREKSATYLGTDISIKALQIAKTNARKLKLTQQVKFLRSNLFSKIKDQKFDIIIANLPYLTQDELKEASIAKEPRLALLAGSDGLSYYRKLLEQLPNHLNKKYLVLLEINPQQKNLIKKAIAINLPKAKIKFLKDLAGNIRIVSITA